MAANITITRAPSNQGVELIRSPRSMELIKLVGTATAVDDTGTYNVQSFKPDSNTIIIGGGYDITAVSGQQITVRAKLALGGATNYVWVASGL